MYLKFLQDFEISHFAAHRARMDKCRLQGDDAVPVDPVTNDSCLQKSNWKGQELLWSILRCRKVRT